MWCWRCDWWPTTTSGYEVGWRADRWCVKQQEMSCRIMGPCQSLFFAYRGAGTQGEHSLGSHDWCPPPGLGSDRLLVVLWMWMKCGFCFSCVRNAAVVHNIFICYSGIGIKKCHVLQICLGCMRISVGETVVQWILMRLILLEIQWKRCF